MNMLLSEGKCSAVNAEDMSKCRMCRCCEAMSAGISWMTDLSTAKLEVLSITVYEGLHEITADSKHGLSVGFFSVCVTYIFVYHFERQWLEIKSRCTVPVERLLFVELVSFSIVGNAPFLGV